MTISVLIVFLNKKCYPYCAPLTFFFLQLILNLSWTTVFFSVTNARSRLFNDNFNYIFNRLYRGKILSI